MKTVAIIPAGGSGKRMKEKLSKQYLLLDGIPILVHTLRIFQNSTKIDEIFLIVPENDIEFARRHIVEKYGISKVSRVLKGGRERQDSVRQGVNVLETNHDIVIIHDGVRPFITEEMLHAVFSQAARGRAVTIGVPVKDTVKSSDGHGWVRETLDRDSLWLIQTPQAFTRDVIQKAYDDAYNVKYYGTDDASLVERIGVHVKVIHGSYDNIKITTKDDIVMAEFLVQKLKKGVR
jgi:2-C-methyl-D-erythritol 4-phosphate cytidylyltransferase